MSTQLHAILFSAAIRPFQAAGQGAGVVRGATSTMFRATGAVATARRAPGLVVSVVYLNQLTRGGIMGALTVMLVVVV